MRRASLASLCAAGLAASSSAQIPTLDLDLCGGGIGKPVTVRIQKGIPFYSFLAFTSFQRGNLPLSIFDKTDTRSIRVGLELLPLLFVGRFDSAGKVSFSVGMPNDATLVGRATLHQIATIPGKTFTFGPISDVAVLPIESAGAFRAQANTMGSARAFASTTRLTDGRHLVVGGGTGGLLGLVGFKTSEVYDAASRRFSAGPSMAIEHALHTSTKLADGRTLIVGGVDYKNDPHVVCEIYDPKTNAFTRAANMAFKRMGHTATLLPDGRVLVTGGLADLNNQLAAIGSALNATEIYDPVKNTWTRGPNMSAPRAAHSAVLLPNKKVLLAGGLSWTFFIIKIPTFLASCDLYDPATNKMSKTGSMTGGARAAFSTALLGDGRVLAAGGAAGSILNATTTNVVSLYDPTKGTWSAGAALTSPRGLASALLLRDGKVAVLGGATGSLLKPLAIAGCELFDPKTSTWSGLPSLRTPRAGHAAIELGACGVLVLGGGTGTTGAVQTSLELLIR